MRADAFLQLRMREIRREEGGEKCSLRIYMVVSELRREQGREIRLGGDEERDAGYSQNAYGTDGQKSDRTGPAGKGEDNECETDKRHDCDGGVAQDDTEEEKLEKDRASEAQRKMAGV